MTTTMALSRWSRSASEPIRGEAALASAAAACAAATHVFFVPRRRSRAAVARSSRDVSSFLKRAPLYMDRRGPSFRGSGAAVFAVGRDREQPGGVLSLSEEFLHIKNK